VAGGPETQHGNLGIAYNYQPVETRLNSPIQLPGTGDLWAKVGQTALNAASQLNQTAQMMQASPLNPAVLAAQNYGVAQYDAATEHIDKLTAAGPRGQMLMATSPQGLSTVAPAQAGTAYRMMFGPYGGSGSGKGDGSEHPGINPGTEKDPEEKPAGNAPAFVPGGANPDYILNPATGSYELRQGPPPAPSPDTKTTPTNPKVEKTNGAPSMDTLTGVTKADTGNAANLALNTQVPSQGGSTAALTAGPGGVLNSGQSQSSDVVAQSAAQYRAQYAATHFLNPATGSYEPLQTQPPPPPSSQQPAPQQGGSIWSPQRPAPMAPPAPTPGAPPDQSALASTPGTVPGSLSDQYAQRAAKQQQDMQMSNWQNQTQTEPMTADDAMKWMKRKTTLAQDATYLPHGGPPGPDGQPEPAYALHMKGGGINTVPISQMVKDGGGAIVAAQNTSAVLSQTDRLQQQQQNALGSPPDQSQQLPPGAQGQPPVPQGPQAQAPGPNISSPPPANLPQYPNISPPPPAPNGQPRFGGQGQLLPPAQGGQVWTPQQPSPGPIAPPAPGQGPLLASTGYNPSMYRQAVANAVANPENLTADNDGSGPPARTNPLPSGQEFWDTSVDRQGNPVSREDIIRLAPSQANENPENLNKATGDYLQFRSGGHDWYADREHGGRLYTTGPGNSSWWDQNRYYLDKDQWEEVPLKNSWMKQKLMQEGAGVIPGLTMEKIDGMGSAEIEQNLHQLWRLKTENKSEPDTGIDSNLTHAFQIHQGIQKIKDMITVLGGPNADSSNYNKIAYDNAGIALDGLRYKSNQDNPTLLKQLGGLRSGVDEIIAGKPSPGDQARADLGEAIANVRGLINDKGGTTLAPGSREGVKGPGLDLPIRLLQEIRLKLPDIEGGDVFNRIQSGQGQKSILQALDDYDKRVTDYAHHIVQTGQRNMYAISSDHIDADGKIQRGITLPDSTNHYAGRKPNEFPYDTSAYTTPSATPAPTPKLPIVTNQAERDKLVEPGGYYQIPGDPPGTRRQRPLNP
jgi:hypothetical protein